jgi:hypothetical protein
LNPPPGAKQSAEFLFSRTFCSEEENMEPEKKDCLSLFCVNGEGWRTSKRLVCSLCGRGENITREKFYVTSIQVDMDGRYPRVQAIIHFSRLRNCPDCGTLYPEGKLPKEALAGGPWKFPDQVERERDAWESKMAQGI